MSTRPSWSILGGGYQSYLKGDYEAAYKEWLPLAELGDAEAQYNIGVMYDEGTGLQKDLTAAADWYRKAAEQGYVDAQTNLGLMYYHGQGVSCDHEKAKFWFTKAADQGDREAEEYLDKIEAAPPS